MQKLTDREIRRALLDHLMRRQNKPRAALQEVHVCNGNAVADVVAVYKAMHCYEIKGETDSIGRVVRQSQYYDQAFPLVSLVTTYNHIAKAEKIAPAHWGLIVAKADEKDAVRLRSVRGAKTNTAYRPEISLLSLWRSELLEIVGHNSAALAKMNREKIALLIAHNAPKYAVSETIGVALAARARQPSK
jgi:hypothetical protein